MPKITRFLYRLKRKGNSLEMNLKGRNINPKKRGACLVYSTFSQKRLHELLFGLDFPMVDFLTLTFRDEIHFSDAKAKLKTFFQLLRRKYPDVRYIWAQEFQQRGVIHFHILVNLALPSKMIWQNDEQLHILTFPAWPYGGAVITKVDYVGGLGKYLCGDISKINQREGHFLVGRWWGNSRGIVPRGEWIVGDDVAKNAYSCGVGAPLYKWHGNLHAKNTYEKFAPVLKSLELETPIYVGEKIS